MLRILGGSSGGLRRWFVQGSGRQGPGDFRVQQSWISSSQPVYGGGPVNKKRKGKENGRREQLTRMKNSRHKMRIDTLQNKGRSGGGQSQLLDARMRRARDQRNKFDKAREFVQRNTNSREERLTAEARILRQRSQQLKNRGTPGLGFTPARFRLLPIANESGTDLTALSRNTGNGSQSMTIKELKEQVKMATFDNLGLEEDVVSAAKQVLEAQQQAKDTHGKDEVKVVPTQVQALGIPEILGHSRMGKQRLSQQKGEVSTGQNVFLAAETGSGKTLAYVLPIVSMLKQEERAAKNNIRHVRCPRVLIAVPSRELVSQVTAVFKSIGHLVKIRTVGVHLGMTRRGLREKVGQGPIDVIVATPGAALNYMRQDPIFLAHALRRLVVDEADSLMDSHSFGSQISDLMALIRKANVAEGRREQVMFVSATLPKMIHEQTIRRYPDVVHVTTPALHRAPQRLSQTFIDVTKDFQGSRMNALWFALRTAASDKHIIVFCNNKAHAKMVFQQLHSRGVSSLLLVGADFSKRAPREDENTTRLRNRSSGNDGSAETLGLPDPEDPWEKATWFAGQEEAYAAIDREIGTEQNSTGGEETEGVAADVTNGVNSKSLQMQSVPTFKREEILRAFSSPDPIPAHLLLPLPASDAASTENGTDITGKRKILVCTDLASRGLDTTCVSHVILFDFPTTAIDYLHRSGRTARAGAKGKVTALVGKRDRRLADQIHLAIRQGGIIN
ncbi:P-loop containing nucleoside triphosphate hydrolase protein [Coemansia reversa NRRL 1564]|uniref:P-loop containing nucleoside triphosphate hydrolase protein n=1 Tax=Coemansia reversa (strain ATCC 12441 / NRRL 1564) TaxID=763665 RepID=A0A2G5BHV9_COERN|nr:P-loop containing nucleoside triphosphate hydrolase protein [Coemansia reversa NRRL 1564]|eukprot:PIA18571.1 P-loop containing nucleoside triphosphate hydrolase protein [Coemansia reversa NRRL 1564]